MQIRIQKINEMTTRWKRIRFQRELNRVWEVLVWTEQLFTPVLVFNKLDPIWTKEPPHTIRSNLSEPGHKVQLCPVLVLRVAMETEAPHQRFCLFYSMGCSHFQGVPFQLSSGPVLWEPSAGGPDLWALCIYWSQVKNRISSESWAGTSCLLSKHSSCKQNRVDWSGSSFSSSWKVTN